jgi:hypothetical protein
MMFNIQIRFTEAQGAPITSNGIWANEKQSLNSFEFLVQKYLSSNTSWVYGQFCTLKTAIPRRKSKQSHLQSYQTVTITRAFSK